MRKLLTAAVLTAVIATPALAQPARRSTNHTAPVATAPWDAVVVDGQKVGQDPDPFVRQELQREVNGPNEG